MTIRQPAVAGMFYPHQPARLKQVVDEFIAKAASPEAPVPKAIIAPHAGYPYSGPVAASAYARLAPARGLVRRVVLIGPSHRVPFRGIAATEATAYATPLGNVPVDREAVARALRLPGVGLLEAAHLGEHSLEVQLPFLQEALGDFSLVPLVAGDADAQTVARVLEALWDGPETLIVVSSDLSHYLDYDSARRIDATTTRAIERLDPDGIGGEQACGRVPIRGLLAVAKQRGLRVETLDLRSSGDTAGPRDAVVGYGAWAFYESETASGADEDETARDIRAHGNAILRLAGMSILNGLKEGSPLAVRAHGLPPVLARPGASFVTLKKDGELRGCVGSPRPVRPLAPDVAHNAHNAAFRDPRFPALEPREVPDIAYSVAVLTPPRPLAVHNEHDLLRALRPGVDGLIIAKGPNRALFLPAVWESLPEPERFLAHLKLKAGLDPHSPVAGLEAECFQSIDITGGRLAEIEAAAGSA